MRIERLDLIAFGTFTDTTLDLRAPGVHMVYGPNESGKTTTTRKALRSLLYGIDRRTSYGFLHDLPSLKLGAVLSDGAGDALEVVRHKRNKNPLTGPDGAAIPEGRLLGLLNGVSEETFTSTFALTHDELKKGGKNLARGEGDLGQALYSARSSQNLTAVLEELERRQRELYLRTGINPVLNAALRQRERVAADLAAASTTTDEYLLLCKEVGSAEEAFKELDRRFAEAETESKRQDALAAALPSLRIRRQALARLAEMIAEGPLAASDAEARLGELEEAFKDGQRRSRQLERTLESYLEELAGLEVDERLLSARESIGALVRSIEKVDETARSLEELTQEAWDHRDRAGKLLRQVRPGAEPKEAAQARVAVPISERVATLAKKRPELSARADSARKQTEAKAREAKKAQAALAKLPNEGEQDVLGTVIAELPSTLVDDLAPAHTDEAATAARLNTLVTEAGWGSDAVETLLAATVPSRAEVTVHRDRFTRHATELDNQRKERSKAARALKRAQGKLEALCVQSDTPTLEDLQRAREARDGLWAQIREGESRENLARDFEAALASTDGVADRLRTEAEQVAERLTLENRVRELGQDLADREEDLEAAAAAQTELENAWEAMWPSQEIPAPALDSAETVLGRIHELHELVETHHRQKADLSRLEGSALALTDQLLALLTDAGVAVEPLELQPRTSAHSAVLLPQLVALAREELDRREKAKEKQTAAVLKVQAAEEDLERLTNDQRQAEEELEAWCREWGQAVAAAGFDSQATPEEVQSGLDLLEQAAEAWDQALRSDRKAEATRTEVADFDERLALVFDTCGRELPDERATRSLALDRLHSDVKDTAGKARRREELNERVAEDEAALEEARSAMSDAEDALAALLAETGVATTAELRQAIDRVRQVEQERERVSQAERQLSGYGDIDTLEKQEQDLADAEELARDARRHWEDVKRQRDDANTSLAKTRAALALIDETSEAARLAEDEAALSSQIADQVEEYMRVTLARQILLERMEDYRKRNQDPILLRAEELFSVLTLREFPRLSPDLDDKGRNVLRVVRRNGREEEISALSEGTTDQLYLALRLASLERYVETGQAMPLVLDDTLMTFDDERAEAALRILDEISDRFQVVVLTHHEHLADLAMRVLPDGRAHLHQLPRFTSPSHAVAVPPSGVPVGTDRSENRAAPGQRTCRDCGKTFIHVKRGRPPVLCPQCRG